MQDPGEPPEGADGSAGRWSGRAAWSRHRAPAVRTPSPIMPLCSPPQVPSAAAWPEHPKDAEDPAAAEGLYITWLCKGASAPKSGAGQGKVG